MLWGRVSPVRWGVLSSCGGGSSCSNCCCWGCGACGRACRGEGGGWRGGAAGAVRRRLVRWWLTVAGAAVRRARGRAMGGRAVGRPVAELAGPLGAVGAAGVAAEAGQVVL